MTDEAITEDLGEGVEVEAKPREGGMSGKKLVLFIVLPLVLVLGGATVTYVAGVLDPLLGKSEEQGEEAAQAKATPAVFYDLPEMLVNLNGGGRKASYLKISVSLELEDAGTLEHVDQVLPRIVDSFQVYLRELRLEDLQGSAGLLRLKEELLVRINATARPIKVKDVLFKEMLVQ